MIDSFGTSWKFYCMGDKLYLMHKDANSIAVICLLSLWLVVVTTFYIVGGRKRASSTLYRAATKTLWLPKFKFRLFWKTMMVSYAVVIAVYLFAFTVPWAGR